MFRSAVLSALGSILITASMAAAQGRTPPVAPLSYTLFGAPGLIDMPTAQSAPDAEMAASLTSMGGTTRATLTFQITPRLSGSFRYSQIARADDNFDDLWDRSFDLRYRVLDEGKWTPALAIGMNDFVGTGIYSGQYVVVSKTLTPRLTGTVGIGWGRLGGEDYRFDRFASAADGQGGELELGDLFQGPTAVFGGLSYRLNDRLDLKLEYSSDHYALETQPGRDGFDRKSPVNIGLDWRVAEGTWAKLAYMHGGTLAAGLTFAVNPRRAIVNGDTDPAPQAVLARAPGEARNLDWTAQADAPEILQANLRDALANDGIALEAARVEGTRTRILIRNIRWRATAQAVGRAARVMTRTLPASVETFEIVPVRGGLPSNRVILRRSDIEALENAPDASVQSLVRAQMADGFGATDGVTYEAGLYPRAAWSLGPYIETALFDPDNPVRADLGLQLDGIYTPAPGLSFAATYRHRVIGNRQEADRPSDSVLPRVRSEAYLYARETGVLSNAYANYQWRPGPDLYARVTGGYLERQFAGLSTEVLWKPVESQLALGLELNYARQREFSGLGMTDYGVVTGHASAYWTSGSGVEARLDVGRYLAADYGATFTVGRSFRNGWRVAAYATLTDVSFEEFGEGSFDKGIRLTIPLDPFVGRSTGQSTGGVLRPILRDGGARLAVPNRLYWQVRNDSAPVLDSGWGRFWR